MFRSRTAQPTKILPSFWSFSDNLLIRCIYNFPKKVLISSDSAQNMYGFGMSFPFSAHNVIGSRRGLQRGILAVKS